MRCLDRLLLRPACQTGQPTSAHNNFPAYPQAKMQGESFHSAAWNGNVAKRNKVTAKPWNLQSESKVTLPLQRLRFNGLTGRRVDNPMYHHVSSVKDQWEQCKSFNRLIKRRHDVRQGLPFSTFCAATVAGTSSEKKEKKKAIGESARTSPWPRWSGTSS